MKHLFTMGLLLLSLSVFCQTNTGDMNIGIIKGGYTNGEVYINWDVLGFKPHHDTLVVTDLGKIHFIRIGGNVYEFISPAPYLRGSNPTTTTSSILKFTTLPFSGVFVTGTAVPGR